MNRSRVILSYGRFDGLSQHHVRFLRSVSAMGHELIIGCTSDALAAQNGMPCTQNFETRRAVLESCRFVSRVIPQTSLSQKRTDIVNYNVSVLVSDTAKNGLFDDLQDVAQVIYLPPHPARKYGHEPEFQRKIRVSR
ncbi:glycerol-3-phosphate cytidylyltransferase [Sulfitobacter sp. M57]|uniref:glycerol-3-phosphate cytidylyltransferase n=1 Tax=unclassified Sulfitobacter TaxID=196795 RepID=UPI0023E24301|nr:MULTISPECIES: glycerol-3-phosphate cytidylyltransferase [unclassified Sulfitobacter]MDF3413799.1 glycerol-3-phosphate cytidylyltransferase [Sulfitobacter sp. KE5]MDF3420920.1 glycerol-3-phosphate cytidylyltransferase [Sulfitobacter sp. KE43]MDF3432345.1 glycerol-3-phosphate cytidylyltransferase [Sulfitobacter sp. KE42]MDF3457984.1 glycerol-3-phosphate cytidylyltransferase [Sulfitobacter sp. S74]MDF3461885.1 glycerol-3-phosphate cytidylyltransferase [Sulfitobacter sp. Ks18]